VAESLRAAGFAHVRLKWPNDLVVSGPSGLCKLGGLLVEGSGEHGGPARGVIGIGLNLALPTTLPHIDQPWTDLARLGGSLPPRNILAAALLAHLLPVLAQFDQHGLAPMLHRYAALDALYGQAVEIQTVDGTQHGTAVGIAPDGTLRVRLADGEQRFHSAEVSLRQPATSANC